MAQILGYSILEFGPAALEAANSLRISSMGTVFAESEVISLLTLGHDKRENAYAVHYSGVERLHPLVIKMET